MTSGAIFALYAAFCKYLLLRKLFFFLARILLPKFSWLAVGVFFVEAVNCKVQAWFRQNFFVLSVYPLWCCNKKYMTYQHLQKYFALHWISGQRIKPRSPLVIAKECHSLIIHKVSWDFRPISNACHFTKSLFSKLHYSKNNPGNLACEVIEVAAVSSLD